MRKHRHINVPGPLAPYAASFEKDLGEQGYRSGQVRLLWLMAEVSHWLGDQNLAAGDLTAQRVDQFLSTRRVAGRASSLSVRGLSPLLNHLIGIGIVSQFEPVVADTPVERLMERYRRYLAEERGLAAQSIRHYVDVANLFCSSLPGGDELEMDGVTTARITEFVLAECRRCQPASAKAMTTRLRSLLRFFYVEGLTPTPLAGAVPTVPSWRQSSLPKALSASEVTRLLKSCDRRKAVGRRDFTILVVLSRLGLRAGEVAGLQLGDIDWHQGELVIRGKGNREDRLPLPVDVGEAIVAWLQRGRPRCGCQSVFLRLRAPHRGHSSGGISAIVIRACERAGLSPVGAHRLRHTAATEMLRAGGSLAEVGQILRHRSHDTTSIYAKVDRRSLIAVVRPWPGGAA